MTDFAGLTNALADRYTIERELGQGGMATVYLAHDIKHDRPVAIKVLKPELAAVLGADRFVVEIKTTAALQHPHILPLFDSGTADHQLFYVMPFVQGETLREKLNRETQFGVDEAVRIAREVADALDYAHRHGVIHRDIKPENIMLHDGRPMVMDFGIALAVSAAAGGRMTETGLSLGTPHYMSPEQATAEKEITGRSDIYSLASVLYEMLAGQPPHIGGSAQQVIMKIIAEQTATVTTLRRSVPANVAAALAKALEKLPADRFDSAREFSQALADPHFTTASMAGVAGSAPTVHSVVRHPLLWGLAFALVAMTAFAGVQWQAAHRAPVRSVVHSTLSLPSAMLATNAAQATNVAVSPDGNTLAYTMPDGAGASRLFVRLLSEGTARGISGTDGAQQPCFSPDGTWIAYLVGTSIWKVQAAGGTPVLLAETGVGVVGLTWTGTGMILAGAFQGLVSVPASGGAPTIVVRPDTAAHELYFNQPRVMPDGKTVLFSIQPNGGLSAIQLGVLHLETGAVTRTNLNLLDVVGYYDGTLVYVLTSGALMAVPFDYRAARTTGSAVALGPSVTTMVAAAASMATMSPTGTLVYQPANSQATIGWVNAQGAYTPLLAEPQAYAFPRISPDGKRVAMAITAGGRSDVWLYDMASATPTRATNSGQQSDRPEWTPDGRRILYRTDRSSRTSIWWQPTDLSAPASVLLADDQNNYYEAVISPDGKQIVYQVDNAGVEQANILYRTLAGDTTSVAVATSRAVEAQPRLSPDGKWVAFVTDASGASQVMVQPFPGPGGQVQISVAGGSEPVWSRDGRRIFYRDGHNLVAAAVSTVEGLSVTSRVTLFPDIYLFAAAPHANYDVSPDGTRLLMIRSVGTPEYEVIYGWGTELRARMRSGGLK
ncbi:MAG: protein kinase [Gemmatimonadota bacterium]